MTLFGALPPNRTQTMTLTHSGAPELGQLMEGTTAGALIPRADSKSVPSALVGAASMG